MIFRECRYVENNNQCWSALALGRRFRMICVWMKTKRIQLIGTSGLNLYVEPLRNKGWRRFRLCNSHTQEAANAASPNGINGSVIRAKSESMRRYLNSALRVEPHSVIFPKFS